MSPRALRSPLLGALLVGAPAAVSVVHGGQLVPDTAAYARGSSAWSSPAAAFLGGLLGLAGVQALAIAGGLAVGVLLGLRIAGARLLLGVAAVVLLPWGAALLCAGADAVGAAALLAAYGRRRSRLALCAVAFFHLVAALELAAALLARGRARRLVLLFPLAAGAVGIAVMPLLGRLLGSHEPTQLQWRYLLPGVLLLAARSGTVPLWPTGARDVNDDGATEAAPST